MFCKNCGSNISDEAVFCPHCGAQAGEAKGEPNKQTDNAAKPQTSNVVGLVGFILAMVSVLFWIIGLLASSILFIVSLMLGISAIVCSAIGMKSSAKSNGQYRGLSIGGLVVGIVVVAISVILFIIGLAALSAMF
ncbi:MAG: zinc-ribbon domain-containing protein [Clostridiales bacterium]|nr:zinc-ribbon domain-containing protein [Clostridiales bacterium]MDE6617672.1 zinc-ribbon domain-containing protein [Clostridiales bacterium]